MPKYIVRETREVRVFAPSPDDAVKIARRALDGEIPRSSASAPTVVDVSIRIDR